MLPVYGHDRCPLERDETTSTDPEVIITLSEKPRPRANLDDILVVEHQGESPESDPPIPAPPPPPKRTAVVKS